MTHTTSDIIKLKTEKKIISIHSKASIVMCGIARMKYRPENYQIVLQQIMCFFT